MIERGKLLVVEGGVGAGKSTQLLLLSKEIGNGWLYYREPGDTIFGDMVRDAVQSLWGGDEPLYPVHPIAAVFGYSASRANLIRTKVIPNLETGKNVGLDRYWYSTYAYQGAEGVPKVLIFALSLIATKGLKPDLVLHYDLLPEIGIERKKKVLKLGGDVDRYDRMDPEFHGIVRTNYHHLKYLFPGIWKVIDASKSIEEVKKDSLTALRERGLLE